MQRHNSDPDDNGKTAVSGDVVHGHKVGGDQYDIGTIENSDAVAIGAGARAEINHYTEIIVKLDTIEDLPPAPGDPPYKGLAYFTEKDADIYYGRESLSQHISTRLNQQHFLALIGASGSGKSSLLRAGVIPRLREQRWLIHVITPGKHPLSALTNALARDVDSLDFAPKLEKMMRQKAETLHLIGNKFASRANAPRLLLAVDQFEEVFTQCHDESERRAFVENLLTAANKQGSVTILIGLRADFYDRCAHFEGLRELVSQQQEFIGPMNQQELVRVIAEPAKRGGWQFVEGLVEQIIEDAGQEPGRLPLLSHALRETWERRRGTAMTLAGYRAAGGVEGAIAKTAEETLGRFDEGETAVAQSVFLSLTELGEGAEDTRRIASLTELEEANADKPLDGVLQMLINARLITTGDGQVEVAHEALIRRWPRLHGWIADNRERLRFERQLAQDAQAWHDLGKDHGSLYRGAKLQQAIEASEKDEIQFSGLSARFLGASRAEAERESREKEAQRQRELAQQRALAETERQRAQEAEISTKRQKRITYIALVILCIALIAMCLAGVFGVKSTRDAERATEAQATSEYNERISDARALAAEAEASVSLQDIDRAYLKAIQAITTTHTSDSGFVVPEAETALYHALELPLIGVLPMHDYDMITDTHISDDGEHILLNGTLNRASLWNIHSELIAIFENTSIISFAARNNRVFTASPNGTAKLWNINGEFYKYVEGHSGVITSVAFSSNGERMVTASDDGMMQLRDGEGDIIFQLENRMSQVRFIVFAPDNNRFIVVGCNKFVDNICSTGGVDIWSKNGDFITTLEGHLDTVSSAIFSHDSSRLLTASDDGIAILWDENQEYLNTLDHINSIIGFSADGNYIGTYSYSVGAASVHQESKIWNRNGDLVDRWVGVQILDFSPNTNSVVVANVNDAQIRDMVGNIIISLENHDGPIMGAKFSADGKYVVTTSFDRTARIWDGNKNFITSLKWETTEPFMFHYSSPNYASFNIDGSRIVTVRGTTPVLWDDEGHFLNILEGHIDWVNTINFSSDGQYIVTASRDGKVILWNASGRFIKSFEGHIDSISSAKFNNDSSQIVVTGCNNYDAENACTSGFARIWNINGDVVATLNGHIGNINEAQFSPDDQYIVTVSDDGMGEVWDKNGNHIVMLKGNVGGSLNVADFSPDGSFIITAGCDELNDNNLSCKNGVIWLWDQDGSLIAKLDKHRYAVHSVKFSPDSQYILTADSEAVYLWNTKGEHIQSLEGQRQISSINFSSDGERIITAGCSAFGGGVTGECFQGMAWLWNIEGHLITTFAGHSSAINTISINPDGDRILTASGYDDSVRLWEVYTDVETMLTEANTRLSIFLSNE